MSGPPKNIKNPRWLVPMIIIFAMALSFSNPGRHKKSSNNHIKSHKQIQIQEEKASQTLYPDSMRNEDNMGLEDNYTTDDLIVSITDVKTDETNSHISFKIINRTYERIRLDEDRFKAYDVFGNELDLNFSQLKKILGESSSILGQANIEFTLVANSNAAGFVRFEPTILPDSKGNNYGQWVLKTDAEFEKYIDQLNQASSKARDQASSLVADKKAIDKLEFPKDLFQRKVEDNIFRESGYLSATKNNQTEQKLYVIEFDIDGNLKSFELDKESLLK